MVKSLAPIALFTFKRPHHVRNALHSLRSNPEFERSPVYIFCDGARHANEQPDVEASRQIVRSLAPKHAVIVERTANLGLDQSITREVTALCEKHGRVIVIEDDLEVSRYFLGYMNCALDKYEDHANVFQVSGHMFPVKSDRPDRAFFYL